MYFYHYCLRDMYQRLDVLYHLRAQLAYLNVAAQSAKPGPDQLQRLLKPTCDKIQAIQSLREKNRASAYFNHLSAISESIPALGWVAVVSLLEVENLHGIRPNSTYFSIEPRSWSVHQRNE